MGNVGVLNGIYIVSGVAEDGDGKYRGFLTVRAQADNGDILLGQLSPEEVRQMALGWLEGAEAADQDSIVMTMLIRDIGLEPRYAAGFVKAMRKERNNNGQAELDDDADPDGAG